MRVRIIVNIRIVTYVRIIIIIIIIIVVIICMFSNVISRIRIGKPHSHCLSY